MKFIAYYQTVAGAIGLLITLSHLADGFSTNRLITSCVALALYGVTLASGIFLLQRKMERGRQLAIISCFFQIVYFAVIGFAFKFVSGVSFGVMIDLTQDTILRFNAYFSSFRLNFLGTDTNTYIGINFIPLIILHFLYRK